MTFQTNRKRMVGSVSISLTDIVLLLLIFFLLSSSFVLQPGIKVKLPKAVTGESQKSNQISITLANNGDLYLNQRNIKKQTLGAEITRLLANRDQTVVVLRSDRNVTIEKAVEIIDIAKLAGAERFLIATQSDE